MKRSLLVLSCWFLAPAAFAILDTNNNGVSDFWEREFNNGNLFDVSFDPQGDPDGDGWTNAQEAEADTNPFHPNPPDGMICPITGHVPAVWSEPDEFNEIYLISPEAVTVTWPTIAGKLYNLEFSSTLMQGSWLPVGDAFVAYGGETTYGFEVSLADKCFWRVSVTDVDSDNDGLVNYEEVLAGTNPYGADSDSDTISDWQEFMGGSDPLNQDTDGDGTPDPLDPDPLINALAFADADGDGISDASDATPNEPRGPAPSIASDNVIGNPVSNLIKDETEEFVLTVSNPAGSAPTASNLTFFINGTEKTATFTAIGSPIGSSQRFLLSWAAETTVNYPTLTIQNLKIRFRDSEQATSWLNLARIDVAEWEGKIITLPYVYSDESWSYEVITHSNGIKKKAHFVSKNAGSNNVYRGPRAMTLVHSNGGSTQIQLEDHAIPFLKISGSPGGAPSVVEQQDFADIVNGVNSHFIFVNECSKSINVAISQAGIDTSLNKGEKSLHTIDLTNSPSGLNAHVEMSYKNGRKDDGTLEWIPFSTPTWPMGSISTNSRIMSLVNFIPTAQNFSFHSVRSYMYRDAKITPYAPGTLEYPGLPLESATSANDQKCMAMGSEEWRKVVIKIFPPQQHFTYSRGYRLNIGTGTTGSASPQTGWMAQTRSGGTLTALTIPTDGKIDILETDTNLYPQLTSPEGLVLFIKRNATVDQVHTLSVDVLPIVETSSTIRLGALNILPVDIAVDADRDGEITFDQKDKTTTEKPYRFWVNDDLDRGNSVDDGDWEEDDLLIDTSVIFGDIKDGEDEQLNSRRDLEDLTRLWIDFSGINNIFPASDPTVELKVRIEANAGNPEINLYQPVETDGGREYLKDEDTGYNQLQGLYGYHLCQVTRETIVVPRRALQTLPSDEVIHLLFEGVKEGQGRIIFELWKEGMKICDLPPVELCLKKAKDMYETWTVGDVVSAGVDFSKWPEASATKTSGQDLPTPESPEEKDYIMFIHGWNMPPWEKETYSSTMFKRMWHQGYKGRFGAFRWPTFHGLALDAESWTNVHSAHFDGSERRAWLSAAPLASLAASLAGIYKDSTGNSLVRFYAHSMGNIVASEALRQMTAAPKVHTYISAQAALSSHVWDNTTAEMTYFTPTTPNIYGYYWQPGATSEPHFWDAEDRPSYMSPGYMPASTTMVNHYNPEDWALSYWKWQINQSLKPDYYYYYSRPPFDLMNIKQRFWTDIGGSAGVPTAEFTFPNDRFQVFSYAAESRGYATGQQGATGGNFDTNKSLNLNGLAFQFGSAHKGHSAQFRSTIQKRWTYWTKAIEDMSIAPASP